MTIDDVAELTLETIACHNQEAVVAVATRLRGDQLIGRSPLLSRRTTVADRERRNQRPAVPRNAARARRPHTGCARMPGQKKPGSRAVRPGSSIPRYTKGVGHKSRLRCSERRSRRTSARQSDAHRPRRRWALIPVIVVPVSACSEWVGDARAGSSATAGAEAARLRWQSENRQDTSKACCL